MPPGYKLRVCAHIVHWALVLAQPYALQKSTNNWDGYVDLSALFQYSPTARKKYKICRSQGRIYGQGSKLGTPSWDIRVPDIVSDAISAD